MPSFSYNTGNTHVWELQNKTLFASRLIKLSGAQYAYLGLHSKPMKKRVDALSTDRRDMINEGVEFQESVCNTFGNQEVSISLETPFAKIYGSIDGIGSFKEDTVLIDEVKTFNKPQGIETAWFVRKAYAQALFYSYMVWKSWNDGIERFRFARFTGKDEMITIKKCQSIMIGITISLPDDLFHFGFQPTVDDMDTCGSHYLNKGKLIMDAYNDEKWQGIKKLDAEWKDKECPCIPDELIGLWCNPKTKQKINKS